MGKNRTETEQVMAELRAEGLTICERHRVAHYAADQCPCCETDSLRSQLSAKQAECERLRRQLADAQATAANDRVRAESYRSRMVEFERERDRLEAIVAKLPLTADGVRVVPGDVLYCRSGHAIHTANQQKVYRCHHPDCYDETIGDKGPWKYDVGQLYSSESAARAARANH